MADNVKLDSMALMRATLIARFAAAGIDVKEDTWTAQGEQSIALEAYAQQLVELERTMRLFQNLVKHDLAAISDTASEMLIMDLDLAKRWR